MIYPNKYTNLDLSIFSISSLILSLLIKNQIVQYDELLQKIIHVKGDDSKPIFLQSIGFLYLLDKITYHSKLDAFELKK